MKFLKKINLQKVLIFVDDDGDKDFIKKTILETRDLAICDPLGKLVILGRGAKKRPF